MAAAEAAAEEAVELLVAVEMAQETEVVVQGEKVERVGAPRSRVCVERVLQVAEERVEVVAAVEAVRVGALAAVEAAVEKGGGMVEGEKAGKEGQDSTRTVALGAVEMVAAAAMAVVAMAVMAVEAVTGSVAFAEVRETVVVEEEEVAAKTAAVGWVVVVFWEAMGGKVERAEAGIQEGQTLPQQ